MNIVIIGALGRIGQALTADLLEHDHRIVAADINSDSTAVGNSTSIESNPLQHTNINKPEDLDQLIQYASYRGPIDAVINCAYPRSADYGKPLFEINPDSFDENVRLHLGGYFRVAQTFCRYFVDQGHGHVIQLSSIYGVIAPRFDIYQNTNMTMPAEYAAIKAGIIHLGKYFSAYLKGKGVRINTISPGGIFDGQPESFVNAYGQHCHNGGLMAASDLCGMVRLLLSDEARMINGQNLVIDDGFSL